MIFVKRDSDNRIVSVSLEETAEHGESLPPDDPEVAAFVSLLAGGQNGLLGTDLALARVLEDLIDLLIERDTIRFTDFPQAAQVKLLQRRSIRSSMRSLRLLDEEGEGGLL
jgi:hypothetical protein